MQHTNETESSALGRAMAMAIWRQIPLEKRQKLQRRIRQRQQASTQPAEQGASDESPSND